MRLEVIALALLLCAACTGQTGTNSTNSSIPKLLPEPGHMPMSIGVISKGTPTGCNYSFTSNDGSYTGLGMQWKTVKPIDNYVGQQVEIRGEPHNGASSGTCTISIDVYDVIPLIVYNQTS